MFGIFPDGYYVGSSALLLVFLIAVGCVCVSLAFLPALLAPRQRTGGSTAPYECGVDVEDGKITQFDVRFYLIAMLFLVFDCEVVFLFPWAVTLKKMSSDGFLYAMIFLAVLGVGFVYEWKKKSLDW